MKAKIEIIAEMALRLLLFFLIGAVFNIFIAFSSLWFPVMSLFTATLTGFAIFQITKEPMTRLMNKLDK